MQAWFFYKIFLKFDLCNVSLWLHSGWTERVCPQVSYPEVPGAYLSFICGSNFDQPGKCCRLLQIIVMIFSLWLMSSPWEDTLRSCKYPIPHQPPLDLIFTDGSCLKQSLLMVQNGGILAPEPTAQLSFDTPHSIVKKSHSSFIPLSTHLSSTWTHGVLFYLTGYSPSLPLLSFGALVFLNVAIGSPPSGWLLCHFDMAPLLVLSNFLPFITTG